VDILGVIKREHNEVKGLFKEYEALGPRAKAMRTKLTQKIMNELVAHDEAEEKTLYTRLKQRARESADRIMVLEAYTEHSMASELISKLQRMDAADEEFIAMFEVLHESIERHIKDEEGHVHKIAKALLEKDELDELALQFEEAKKGMPARR
jgi:hemerythrin superfamily protein